MNIPLFSIIIPCYNTAQYLKKCIESVIGQTYQNWEIIIVNDGSSDDTESIMLHYAEMDQRIRGITQSNQGLADARNRGVKEAVGEYLLFLDSDDWYKDNNCLVHMVVKINETDPDIVVFCYQRVTDDGSLYREDCCRQCLEQMKEGTYSGEQYLYHVLSYPIVYAWYAVRYAYKRIFWTDNQFEFRIPRFEDIDMVYKILLKAERISVLDEDIYQYRTVRDGSLTSVSKKSMHDLLCVSRNTIDAVDHMDIDEKLKNLLRNNFSCGFFTVLTQVYCLKRDDRNIVLDILNNNRDLMNYTTRKKNLLLKRLISVCGLRIVSKLLFIRMKLKEKLYH